jgi:hypothetical protein
VQPRTTPAGAPLGSPRSPPRHLGCNDGGTMTDLLILAITAALFSASAGLVALFDRM